MRLLQTYPTVRGMTRRRFSEKLVFHCGLCRESKESILRVESQDGLICMSCFNKKLSGEPIVQYRDKEIASRTKRKLR